MRVRKGALGSLALQSFVLVVLSPRNIITTSVWKHSSSIQHPVIMSLPSSPERVQDTLQVLFACANSFLKDGRLDHVDGAEHLMKQHWESFHNRLKFLDSNPTDRNAITRALIFSNEEKKMITNLIELLGASDEELSWFRANINQANHYTNVLVGGNRTRYPDVDSPSYPNQNGEYGRFLSEILLHLRSYDSKTVIYSRFVAIAKIHYVNDGGRLAENLDLQKKENVEVIQYWRGIDLEDWKYGAVVVFGHSPTYEESKKGVTCSTMSKAKVDRAVEMNRQLNLAPVYILCGGPVRPPQTRIVEASMMKEYMIAKHGIPPNQILIEATSEHTYSNCMNAVLIARDAGMPDGTKLVSFMVPDMYGQMDQHEFCIKWMFKSAAGEVYPPLDAYFSLQNGKWDSSIELELTGGNKKFLSPTMLWKNYTSKKGEV